MTMRRVISTVVQNFALLTPAGSPVQVTLMLEELKQSVCRSSQYLLDCKSVAFVP